MNDPGVVAAVVFGVAFALALVGAAIWGIVRLGRRYARQQTASGKFAYAMAMLSLAGVALVSLGAASCVAFLALGNFHI